MFIPVTLTSSVNNSQKTHCIHITRINWSMLFTEIQAIHFQYYMTHTNTTCRQNKHYLHDEAAHNYQYTSFQFLVLQCGKNAVSRPEFFIYQLLISCKLAKKKLSPRPHHEGTHRDSRGVAPLVFNLRARWIWMFHFTPRRFHTRKITLILSA